MGQKAVVYGLDRDGRVLFSRELEFETRADLIARLEPEIRACEMVEVRVGTICVLRLPTRPDP
jgi:hypothetical protein